MSKQKMTAGKTATQNNKADAKWRTVTKNGRTALLSPSGSRYYGTPREIRNAALVPWRRDMLADGLRALRAVFPRDGADYAERANCCAERRRRALLDSYAFDCDNMPSAANIAPELLIFVRALARSKGQTESEYVTQALSKCVVAAMEATGQGSSQLVLTRHEQRALERLWSRTPQMDVSPSPEVVAFARAHGMSAL